MGDASGVALGSSGEAAKAAEEDRQDGGGGGVSGDLSAELLLDGGGGGANNAVDEAGGDRTGNRWPRQETLALLKIRSDMDATFRDSTLKGPLWEEISRKMAELGYKRSAKKCKEKFENVYKYHKRTKEGRRSAGKPDGKTYRFFDELEAFDQNHHPPPSQPPPPKPPTITMPQPTIWSTTTTHNNNNKASAAAISSPVSSSSTASDEDFLRARHGGGRRRKRKWKDFFRRLTRQVVRRQEEMHRRFVEAVARCEAERTARDDAWRAREASRLAIDLDSLARDRSAAAAKDAAILALLRNLSGPIPSPSPSPSPRPSPSARPVSAPPDGPINADPISSSLPPPLGLAGPAAGPASSRWPKAEVEALIRLRTTMEVKYQENGPKGPLWEEISAAMRQAGYDRSAKRCKEKWENINKYFKKVKDNNKKRSQDSKTCPYFHTLDALYREKSSAHSNNCNSNGVVANAGLSVALEPKPDPEPAAAPVFGSEPIMVQPESQWPLQQESNNNNNRIGHDLDVPMNSEELLDDDEEEEEEDDADDVDEEMGDSSSTEVEDQDHHDRREDTVGRESYGNIVPNKMDMVE